MICPNCEISGVAYHHEPKVQQYFVRFKGAFFITLIVITKFGCKTKLLCIKLIFLLSKKIGVKISNPKVF